jgi:hypothetical protein
MGNIDSKFGNLQFKIIPNKSDAQALLDTAENMDFYLAECHDDKSNSIARRNLTYSANMIALRDLNYANMYLEGSIQNLPKRLVSDLGIINVIQLMPTADGGMPHTRPNNIICYPDISQLFSRTTLIHELWHIHQRQYSELWINVFRSMGWNVWDGKLPTQLEKNRRYNPDTLDYPLFIFEGKWVPIPIFKDISNPKVSEVDIWFYNPEKEYHVKQIPNEISSYFPNLPPSAYEHPRELTAYMLSEPKQYSSSKAFRDLIGLIGEISIRTSDNILI